MWRKPWPGRAPAGCGNDAPRAGRCSWCCLHNAHTIFEIADGKGKLRELAGVLREKVRSNATIDWYIRSNAIIDWNSKESVQARLRVIIRRTLCKYGYTPDMQQLATETVMKQAGMVADEIF